MNDISFGTTNNVLCQAFFNLMSKEFEMSVERKLNFFLRLQIKQCQYNMFINHSKYVKELLKRYKLDEVKHTSIPMLLNTKLDLNRNGKSTSKEVYWCIIGLWLYLIVSRPDIMFNICLCARFQSAPKESH